MTHNIIDTINALPYPDKTQDECADLIRLAKIGDRSAAFTLLRLYMAPIMKEVDRVVRGANRSGFGYSVDSVEVFSEAVLIFYRVINAFDPDRGMRGFVSFLSRSLRNAESMSAATSRMGATRIPYQTLIRRSAAIKAADGDIEAARLIAPQHGLTRETFDAVSRVYEGAVQIHAEEDADTPPVVLPYEDRGYIHVEDLQDAARALDALDFTSRLIVESAFGLNGQPQQSNAEIGDSLGMSRWAVQRRIDSAMLTMKQALTEKETK